MQGENKGCRGRGSAPPARGTVQRAAVGAVPVGRWQQHGVWLQSRTCTPARTAARGAAQQLQGCKQRGVTKGGAWGWGDGVGLSQAAASLRAWFVLSPAFPPCVEGLRRRRAHPSGCGAAGRGSLCSSGAHSPAMPAGKHEGSVLGHSASCTMLRLRGQMSHSPAELHVASCRLSKEKSKVHPIEPGSVL